MPSIKCFDQLYISKLEGKKEKRGEKDVNKRRTRKNHKSYKIKILEYQTNKMAQRPAIKSEVMSSTPRFHVVEDENQFLQVFL